MIKKKNYKFCQISSTKEIKNRNRNAKYQNREVTDRVLRREKVVKARRGAIKVGRKRRNRDILAEIHSHKREREQKIRKKRKKTRKRKWVKFYQSGFEMYLNINKYIFMYYIYYGGVWNERFKLNRYFKL